MPKIFLRAPYNYDTDAVSDETGLACKDPSLAIQSSKDESDINVIVDRFLKSGTLPVIAMPPRAADFEDVFDFQTAMNVIRSAKESFDKLPAATRERFNYDPGLFVDFCQDEDNIPAMVKMGLAVKKEIPNAGIDKDAGKPTTPAGSGPGSDQGRAGGSS